MQCSLVDVAERAHPIAQAFERRPRLVGENSDETPWLALLRARRERPRGSLAAEECDELAPLHSITSSARASSVGRPVRPRARAVGRFIANTNLADCTTGKSAGFSPLMIGPA